MSASELIKSFRRRHGLRPPKKRRNDPNRSASAGWGRQRRRPASAPPGGRGQSEDTTPWHRHCLTRRDSDSDLPLPNTLSSSHPLLRFRAVSQAHLRADQANVMRAPKQWRARACRESQVMKLGDALISREELAELLEKEVHSEDASTDAEQIFDVLDVQDVGALRMSLIRGTARQGTDFDVEVEVLHYTLDLLLHGQRKGNHRKPGAITITIGQCDSGRLLLWLLREIDATLGVSSSKYYVVFRGRALKSPFATLGEYGIEGPLARVSILPRISKGVIFKVFVSWRRETVEVDDCSSERTLGWLRARLNILCKVPRDKQRLRIHERWVCAADTTTFDDCGILPFMQLTLEKRKAAVEVSTTAIEPCEGAILLHMLDGRLFELMIEPGDRVAWLKKEVSDATGIAEKDQIVCVFGQAFQDKDALDHMALEEVGIHRQDHVWILVKGPSAMLAWQGICAQLTCSQ